MASQAWDGFGVSVRRLEGAASSAARLSDWLCSDEQLVLLHFRRGPLASPLTRAGGAFVIGDRIACGALADGALSPRQALSGCAWSVMFVARPAGWRMQVATGPFWNEGTRCSGVGAQTWLVSAGFALEGHPSSPAGP